MLKQWSRTQSCLCCPEIGSNFPRLVLFSIFSHVGTGQYTLLTPLLQIPFIPVRLLRIPWACLQPRAMSSLPETLGLQVSKGRTVNTPVPWTYNGLIDFLKNKWADDSLSKNSLRGNCGTTKISVLTRYEICCRHPFSLLHSILNSEGYRNE